MQYRIAIGEACLVVIVEQMYRCIKQFLYKLAKILFILAALYGNIVCALVAQEMSTLTILMGAGNEGHTLKSP